MIFVTVCLRGLTVSMHNYCLKSLSLSLPLSLSRPDELQRCLILAELDGVCSFTAARGDHDLKQLRSEVVSSVATVSSANPSPPPTPAPPHSPLAQPFAVSKMPNHIATRLLCVPDKHVMVPFVQLVRSPSRTSKLQRSKWKTGGTGGWY